MSGFSLLRQSRMLASFLGVQSVVYGVNLVSGVLLVRLLAPSALALYTVAFAAFTLLNVLADGGVTSAMTALGAGVRDEPHRLGALVRDIGRIRGTLGVGAAVVALPVLALSLARLGYGPGATAEAAGLCLAYVLVSASQAVWAVVLRLHGEFRALQRYELAAALARFVLTVTLVRALPGGLVVLAGAVLVQAGVLVATWRRGRRYVAAPVPEGFGPRAWRVVRAALPGVAFFAIQGQVTVGLLALLGSQASVAGAGALARVAVVYAVLGPLVTNVVAPRFALLPAERLGPTLWRLLLGAGLLGTAVAAAVAVLSAPILGVLGDAYRPLRVELVLVAVGGAVAFVGTLAGELAKVRAWLDRSWVVIPATLAVQAVALGLLDVATLRGALLFGLVSQLPWVGTSAYQLRRGLAAARRALPDVLAPA